jgi:hypothetical protein
MNAARSRTRSLSPCSRHAVGYGGPVRSRGPLEAAEVAAIATSATSTSTTSTRNQYGNATDRGAGAGRVGPTGVAGADVGADVGARVGTAVATGVATAAPRLTADLLCACATPATNRSIGWGCASTPLWLQPRPSAVTKTSTKKGVDHGQTLRCGRRPEPAANGPVRSVVGLGCTTKASLPGMPCAGCVRQGNGDCGMIASCL